MQRKNLNPLLSFVLMLILASVACSTSASQPTSTSTPEPTATNTVVPTNTARPSPTPRPTRTPNVAATQRTEELSAEVQAYFDKGYLTETEGRFKEFDDSSEEWAQLDWYKPSALLAEAADFFVSAHFRWSSAYRNADDSGCGIVFAAQENGDHYAVFLDRSKIIFLDSSQSSSYSRPIGTTRGTGIVKFDNPFDKPVEADFTLIVQDVYAHVLVDGEVVGEYTLAQSRNLNGYVGLALLSGTNRDFGTRCVTTNLHLWLPDD